MRPRPRSFLRASRSRRSPRRTTASTSSRRRRRSWRPSARTPSACARCTATDRNRPTSCARRPGGPTARYDRTFTLEVWYPAALAPGSARRRLPHHHARSGDRRDAARPGGARCRAARRRRARFPLVIVSHGYPGQPLPDEPSRREPGQQGLRRGVDRSSRQHLRRPEGVRQHALQPAVRPAVRAERDGPARRRRIGQLAGGPRRRVAHRRSSATRWAATAWST